MLLQVVYYLVSIVADTLTATSRVVGPSRRERRLMTSSARDTQAIVAPGPTGESLETTGQDRDGRTVW